MPVFAYVCTGFFIVALTSEPSPNDQFHEIGVFVEVSVNFTVNGAGPEVGIPVKPATGASVLTVIYPGMVLVFEPPALVAFRETV